MNEEPLLGLEESDGFDPTDDLVTAIETWAEHWNHELQSLIWKKPANEIVSSAKWGCSTPASVKSAMHDLAKTKYEGKHPWRHVLDWNYFPDDTVRDPEKVKRRAVLLECSQR